MENALSSIFKVSTANMGVNTVMKKEPVDSASVTDTVPKKVLERIMKQVVDLEKQMKGKMASKDAELSSERKINFKLKQKNEKLGKIMTSMDAELSGERQLSAGLKNETNNKESEVESLKLEIKVNNTKMDEVLEENRVLMEKRNEIENVENTKYVDHNDLKESLEKMHLQNSANQSRIKSMEKAMIEKDTLTIELKRKISMMITEFSKGVAEKNEEFKLKEAKIKESLKQKDIIIEELIQKNKSSTKEHMATVKEKDKLSLQLATQLETIKTITSEKLRLSSQVEEALSETNKLATQLENKESEKSNLSSHVEVYSSQIGKLTSQLVKIKLEKNKLETQLENMLAKQNEEDANTEFIYQLQNKIAELERDRFIKVFTKDQSLVNTSPKRKINKKRKLGKKRLKNSKTLSRELYLSPVHSDSEILEASNFLYGNTVGESIENSRGKEKDKLLMITYLWPLIPYKSVPKHIYENSANTIEKIKIGDDHHEENKENKNDFDLRFPVNEEDYESDDDSNESDINVNSSESDINVNSNDINEDSSESDMDDYYNDLECSDKHPALKSVDVLGLSSIKQIMDLASDEGLQIKSNDKIKSNLILDASNKESWKSESDTDTEEIDSDNNPQYISSDGPVLLLNPNIKIAEGNGEFISSLDNIDASTYKDYSSALDKAMDEVNTDLETGNSDEISYSDSDMSDYLESSTTQYGVGINVFKNKGIEQEYVNNSGYPTMTDEVVNNDKVDNSGDISDDDSIESDVEYVNDFEENGAEHNSDSGHNINEVTSLDTLETGKCTDKYYPAKYEFNESGGKYDDLRVKKDRQLNIHDDYDNGLSAQMHKLRQLYIPISNLSIKNVDKILQNDLRAANYQEHFKPKESQILDVTAKKNLVESVFDEIKENVSLDASFARNLVKRVSDEINKNERLDAANKESEKSNIDSDTAESDSDNNLEDSDDDDEGPVFVLSDKIKAENPSIKIAQNATLNLVTSSVESPDMIDQTNEVDKKDDLNMFIEESEITIIVDDEGDYENLSRDDRTSNEIVETEQRPIIIMENENIIEDSGEDSPQDFPHLLDHNYSLPYNVESLHTKIDITDESSTIDIPDDSSSELALSELIAQAKAEQMSRCKSQRDQDEVLKAIESIMPEANPPKEKVGFKEDEVLKAIASIMPETENRSKEKESIAEVKKGDLLVVDELNDLIQQLSKDDVPNEKFKTRTIIGQNGKLYHILKTHGLNKNIEQKLVPGSKRKSSEFDTPNDKKIKQSLVPGPEGENCDICGKYSGKTWTALASHKVRCRREHQIKLNERSHCDICGEYYKNSNGLAIHKATKHNVKRVGFLH